MVTKICKIQHKNGYNSGCVRRITQIPAPIRRYSESAYLRVSYEFAQTDPVTMVTKICKIQHKNGYNSGCIRHNLDTSESAHLGASDKFAQTDPVAMVTKSANFNARFAINRILREIVPKILLLRSCTIKCRKKLAQTDPCCNGSDKYKPILHDSAPVNSSEADKVIDYVVYRKMCRTANKVITESRGAHYTARIAEAAETLVDAGRQFPTHFTRRSRELFDHLSKTDDCRAISPLSSSTKFSVSSPPSHSGLVEAITTRCSQMSDMSALLSLTFSRRRLMKF